jgi:hypothetical protein
MGHGFIKGIPYTSEGRTKETAPCIMRVSKSVKEQLDIFRNRLQRDRWDHVSYSDVISYLLRSNLK